MNTSAKLRNYFHFCIFKNLAITFAVAIFCYLYFAEPAISQATGRNPFGVGEGTAGGTPPAGIVAWLLSKQVEFNRAMISALRASRDGGGAWALLSVAFLYGVFHAAGPGHGKAVVSSYVFANEQTIRRGVGVAIAAAALQACVAIALVVPAVLIFGATARQINAGVAWIEIACFSAILLLGLVLTYRKYKDFRIALNPPPIHVHDETCGHGLKYHGTEDVHQHGPHCNHVHLPDAQILAGSRTWKELAAVTIAAGSRPCSGALILLAFAISVGALSIGIIAVFAMAAGTAITTSVFAVGALAAKNLTTRIADKSEKLHSLVAALELVAAILVAMLGALLLQGYIAAG